jgi:hypothetical protein
MATAQLVKRFAGESEQMLDGACRIDALPEEMGVHLAHFLDAMSLGRLSRASKRWYRLTSALLNERLKERLHVLGHHWSAKVAGMIKGFAPVLQLSGKPFRVFDSSYVCSRC